MRFDFGQKIGGTAVRIALYLGAIFCFAEQRRYYERKNE